MQYRNIGNSNLSASVIGLGTMQFGSVVSEADAHRQLDWAASVGINLLDTAELYPSPPSAQSYGETERIIGKWFKRRARREDIIVATKVCGPAGYVPWVREGLSTHNFENLSAAVDNSLDRMEIEYIDLLQLHWPDRATNFFGQLGYKPAKKEKPFDIGETVEALDRLISTGKIRYAGLCNETAWGLSEFLQQATIRRASPIVSLQNPYNLLNRTLEVGIGEILHREGLGLLAYSPLAQGLLTGKYLNDGAAADARLKRFEHFGKTAFTAPATSAVERYARIAQQRNMALPLAALSYVISKPFVSSAIIGATDLRQLEANIQCLELSLDKELLKAIESIHQEVPNPCP